MDSAGDHLLCGRHILVVEDQALVALDLQAELEDHGALVLGPFHDLEGALAALGDGRLGGEGLDGAVLDVDLGSTTVFPLADKLRERGVPFLFHTGHTDLDALHGRYGETIVLLKPSQPQEVACRLRGLLDAVARRRA